jgi:hypothetical protein
MADKTVQVKVTLDEEKIREYVEKCCARYREAVVAELRAAGWVPLDEVLAALRDHDGFGDWAARAGFHAYLDECHPNDDAIRDYLAERFGSGQGDDRG